MDQQTRSRHWIKAIPVVMLVAASCSSDGDSVATDTTGATESSAAVVPEASDTSAAETTTTTAAPAKNTASDQGVTEDRIKVAVLSADLTNLIKNGLIRGVPENSFELNQKRISYYFDKVNADGGINGRQVVIEGVGWDPVDPKSFDDACQKIADGEYFMAINVGGGYNPDKVPCIVDAGTYYVGIDALSLATWDEVAGNALTIAPPSELAAEAGAEQLSTQIAATEKLGVLTGNSPYQIDSYARAKEVLEAAGFDIVYDDPINTATQTAADANRDVLLSVPKMQAAGVTHVISMLPFTNAGNFAGEAEKSGFAANYSIIEISAGACTTFSASQVSAAMEGASCITNWDNFRYDDAGTQKQDTPFEAACRTDYETIYGYETVPGVKFGGADDGTGTFIKEDQSYYECSLMNQVVIPAMQAAGSDLTKQTFDGAALALGSFDVAGFSDEQGSLAPDKPFLATALQQVTVALSASTKGADGLYGNCPAPVNCMRSVSEFGWTPLTGTLGN